MIKKSIVFIALFFTWMLLSGKFDFFHLTLGLISSGLVTFFSGHLLFSSKTKTRNQRFRELLLFPGYVLWLLWEILLSNLHVFYLAFHPRMKEKMNPRLIRVVAPLLKDEFSKYVFANSITLTPGTVTVLVEDNVFTVHAISDHAADGLPEPMQSKVSNVFCPKDKK